MGNPKVTSGVITLKDQGGGVWGSLPLNPPVDGAGFLRFTSTRYIAEDAGLLDITVERYGGNSGALSADITQEDSNRSSGKYTPITIPVSFADGEIGEKTYQFSITTAPTDGPYWINLILNTGPAAVRRWWDNNSEIEVNNGVSVPSIDTANYYTVGPSGDWTTLVDAFLNVQAPALVYVRGGNYENEDTQSDGQGINPKFSGTRQDRIIIASYPQEVVNVIPDTSITDMTSQIPNNNGFFFLTARSQGSQPINGWTIKGLNIYSAGTGIYTDATTGFHQYNNFEDCTIYDCGGSGGTNPAGIRLDTSRYSSVRNCKINNIYEDFSLHLDAHDNNACVHGYSGADIAIEDNTLELAAHCVYHKQPPQSLDGSKGYVIRRNWMGDCVDCIRTEDNYTGRETQKSYIDIDIYHNIAAGANLVRIPNRGTFYSSSGLWIYGNNTPFGIKTIGSYLGVQVYNNLITTTGDGFGFERQDNWIEVADNPYDPSDSGSFPIPGNAESTNVHESGSIDYFDYNLYDPYFSMEMAINSATQAQLVTTIPQWQTTTDPVIMPVAIAGQNSALFDPVYDANFRATVPVPNGRFGEVIGVPDSISVGSNL